MLEWDRIFLDEVRALVVNATGLTGDLVERGGPTWHDANPGGSDAL